MRAPAEPFDCDNCGRRIGRTTTHYVAGEAQPPRVFCIRCMHSWESTSPLHAATYPSCPVAWHDIWDHQNTSATRAGIRWWLSKGAPT